MEHKESSEIFDKINMDDIVKASKNGYKYVTTTPPHRYGERRNDRDKRYIYLHRALLEKKLGRYLKPGEQADHKDGNKNNNDPSNIVLKDLGEHQHDHSKTNHFWTKSPENKPKRKKKRKKKASEMAASVVLKYLQSTY